MTAREQEMTAREQAMAVLIYANKRSEISADDSEICVICQQVMLDKSVATLACGHVFHSSCLLNAGLHSCRYDNYKRTYNCCTCRHEILKLPEYVPTEDSDADLPPLGDDRLFF